MNHKKKPRRCRASPTIHASIHRSLVSPTALSSDTSFRSVTLTTDIACNKKSGVHNILLENTDQRVSKKAVAIFLPAFSEDGILPWAQLPPFELPRSFYLSPAKLARDTTCTLPYCTFPLLSGGKGSILVLPALPSSSSGQGEEPTLQRQFRLYIPFLGIARPQPQFPHSCVFGRFIYSQDQSTYFLQQNRQPHRGNI